MASKRVLCQDLSSPRAQLRLAHLAAALQALQPAEGLASNYRGGLESLHQMMAYANSFISSNGTPPRWSSAQQGSYSTVAQLSLVSASCQRPAYVEGRPSLHDHHASHVQGARPHTAAAPAYSQPKPSINPASSSFLPSSSRYLPASSPLLPTSPGPAPPSLQQRHSKAYSSSPDLDSDMSSPSRYDAQTTAPWARQVISGVDLMRNPKYNKGLAFSYEERDRLYLRGLLPAAQFTQETQMERVLHNIRSFMGSNLDKYQYLESLQERNQRLFFRVFQENFEELLGVVGEPTVHEACQQYGLMFRSFPRALFLSLQDRGRAYQVIKNWPERRIRNINITDGARVGPSGDQGIHSVNVAISKQAVMTASSGLNPSFNLPIAIDLGTNNQYLLESPFYAGLKSPRVDMDEGLEIIDQLMGAVQMRYDNKVVVHFDNMNPYMQMRLLNQYRGEFPCFVDDLQGVAATILAGIMGAAPITKKDLADHTYLIVGDGPLSAQVADLIQQAIGDEGKAGIFEAKEKIWMMDQKGLVVRDRPDADTYEDYELSFIREGPECPDLVTAVHTVRPTVLIGCNQNAPIAFPFTKEVCQGMQSCSERPIIFAMSQPAVDCAGNNAHRWTNGQCLVSVRPGLREQIISRDGLQFLTSQCHTCFVFPGITLGTMISRASKIRDEQLVEAAKAVAGMVTDEDRKNLQMYPSLKRVKDVSWAVARAVADRAYEGGYATNLPKPRNLNDTLHNVMYLGEYRKFR